MHHRAAILSACALLALTLGAPGWGLCEAKPFLAAQRHFEALAAKAVVLGGEMNSFEERTACTYFASTAMLYAVRAHALAQLIEIQTALAQPGEATMVHARIVETRTYANAFSTEDLKVLESLSASSRNSAIRDIGLRLTNEVRVFSRNAAHAGDN